MGKYWHRRSWNGPPRGSWKWCVEVAISSRAPLTGILKNYREVSVIVSYPTGRTPRWIKSRIRRINPFAYNLCKELAWGMNEKIFHSCLNWCDYKAILGLTTTTNQCQQTCDTNRPSDCFRFEKTHTGVRVICLLDDSPEKTIRYRNLQEKRTLLCKQSHRNIVIIF